MTTVALRRAQVPLALVVGGGVVAWFAAEPLAAAVTSPGEDPE